MSSVNNKDRKRLKRSPERPHPFWLFPQEVDVDQSTNEDQQSERKVTLEYLKSQFNKLHVKSAPEELLGSIGAFLESYGFLSTSALFNLERTAREGQTQNHTPNEVTVTQARKTRSFPDLLNIYEDWRHNERPERETATSMSDSDVESDSDSDSDSTSSNENDASIPDNAGPGRSVEESSDSSESSSESESESDASFERLNPYTKDVTDLITYPGRKLATSKPSSSDQSSVASTASTDASKQLRPTLTNKEEYTSESGTSDSDSESSSSSDSDTAKPSTIKALDRSPREVKPRVDLSDSSATLRASSPPPNAKLDNVSSFPTTSDSSSSKESDLETVAPKPNTPILGKRKLEAESNAKFEPAVKRANKGSNTPFQRIPSDIKVDPRIASNAYIPYDYADKAHRDLIVTKGKGFTKEKNKKKRGS